jgi:hypothetical protein
LAQLINDDETLQENPFVVSNAALSNVQAALRARVVPVCLSVEVGDRFSGNCALACV